MPTINKGLLLRLFIVLVVLIGGLVIAREIQADRIPEALRRQAERSIEQGKNDKAIAFTQQYLQFRPNDHQAAIQLGELLQKRGKSYKELTNVMGIYEKVLRENPSQEDVRRKLLDLCLQLNRPADAMIHAKPLIDSYPHDGPLWQQVGIAEMSQNKFEEAKTAFEKSISHSPNNIRSYELLAQVLVRNLNQPKEAGDLLDRMVSKNASEPDAYLIRARFHRSQNKIAECMKDIQKLQELSSDNPDAVLMSSEVLQMQGEVNKARSMLSAGVKKHPKDVRFYRSLSWLELCTGNLPSAMACLEEGIQQLPNDTELLTPLGDLLVQQNQLSKVQEVIKKLETRKGMPSQIAYLKGRVAMAQGKWTEALNLFESLRTDAVALPGLAAQLNLLMSMCNERVGNQEGQLESLQKVLAIDPAHLGARITLGNLHLAAGKLDDAIREYTVAARAPMALLNTQSMLIRLRLAKGKTVGYSREEWKELGEFIGRLRERYKSATEPVILASEWFAAQGEYESSIKLLKEECGKKLNDPRIWVALAKIHQRCDGIKMALDTLDEGQAIVGDQVEFRITRAQLWGEDPYLRNAGRWQELERGLEDLPEAEQRRLIQGLADLYSNIQEADGLRRMLNQMVARNPRDLGIRKLYLQRFPNTPECREAIKAIEGDSGTTLSMIDALQVAETGDPGDVNLLQAREVAAKILAISPDRGDAHFVLARIADRSSDMKNATKHYRAAWEFDRGNLVYLNGYLAHLLASKQVPQAKKVMEQLYVDPRISSMRFQAIAIQGLKQTPQVDRTETITWLGQLVAKDPDILLALATGLAKDCPDDAMRIYRHVVKVQPQLVDGWSGLIQHFARNQKLVEMLSEIKNAQSVLDKPEKFYQLCAASSSTIRQLKADWQPPFAKENENRLFAEATFQLMLLRGKSAEAFQILNQIIGGKGWRTEDIAWAKRNLAMLNAVKGHDRQAALTTLQEPLGGMATTEDLRAKVMLYATAMKSLSGKDRQGMINDAIELLKKVVQDREATPKDWFHLAQFQRMAGNRKEYQKCLQELIKRDEQNLFYVAAYADELLSEGQLDAVEKLIPSLTKAVHDLRAVSTLTRYFCLKEAPSQALKCVEEFIQSADVGTQDTIIRTRQIADVLDQLARISAAKGSPSAKIYLSAALEKYRLTLSSYPEAITPLTSLMAFDNQVNSALDQLSTMKSQLSTRILVSSGLGVLRSGSATPKHFQIVRGWIEEGMKNPKDSVMVQLNLAELCSLQQNFPEAEKIYRQLLQQNPKNVVALNNLAWILAPQSDKAEEATQLVERAIQLLGATGELLDTRARILIASGRYKHAEEDLHEALNQSQTSLRYFHMAIAQLKQSNKPEAVKAFKEAKSRGLDPKKIHPNDLATYKVLATQVDG